MNNESNESMDNQHEELSLNDALKKASNYYEEGRYQASLNIYSAILDVNPSIFIANQRVAIINESFGRHEEALLFYQNIIKYHPLDLGLLSGYIRLTMKTGNIAEARNIFKRTKNIFREAKANDQYNTLAKQLNPEKKLEFFYSYLDSIGIFDYEEGQLMVSDIKISPLLTNSFLGWFETQDWANKIFLELGSGSSTLYFSRYFKKVISWETDENWFLTLSERLPENVELKKVDSMIDNLKSFDINDYDVLLIDCGENRAKVAKIISESGYKGVVFFDNAEWYRNGVRLLTMSGFREIPFFGLKPVQDRVSCTSVLFRDSNMDDIFASNWKSLPKFANYLAENSWDSVEDV